MHTMGPDHTVVMHTFAIATDSQKFLSMKISKITFCISKIIFQKTIYMSSNIAKVLREETFTVHNNARKTFMVLLNNLRFYQLTNKAAIVSQISRKNLSLVNQKSSKTMNVFSLKTFVIIIGVHYIISSCVLIRTCHHLHQCK